MFSKATAFFLLILIFVVSSAAPAAGQGKPSKQEAKAAKVRDKVRKLGTGENVPVKVELYNDTVYRGYLKEAGEDSFVVVDGANNQIVVRYADVDKIGGKNLSTGTKIAIGVGIGVGATLLFLYILWMSLSD